MSSRKSFLAANNRDIYKQSAKNPFSADTKHGKIEYADKKGTHLGEFNTDGVQIEMWIKLWVV